MRLHLVFQSPYSGTAFADCLRQLGSADAVLLLQDGVYAASTGSPPASSLAAIKQNVFALSGDVHARGLHNGLDSKVLMIDESRFVELTTEFDCVQSWF